MKHVFVLLVFAFAITVSAQPTADPCASASCSVFTVWEPPPPAAAEAAASAPTGYFICYDVPGQVDLDDCTDVGIPTPLTAAEIDVLEQRHGRTFGPIVYRHDVVDIAACIEYRFYVVSYNEWGHSLALESSMLAYPSVPRPAPANPSVPEGRAMCHDAYAPLPATNVQRIDV